MSRGVQDPEDHNRICSADEEHAIGKSPGQYAADFGLATQAGELRGMFGGAGDGGFDLSKKFVPQAALLLVIPNRSVGNIDLGLMTNDDPMTH
jgi:hypothetical protein